MKKLSIFAIIVAVIIIGGYYIAIRKPSTDMKSVASPSAKPIASYGTSQYPSAPANEAPAMNYFTLNVKTDPNLGMYLAAQNGMTLYKYTPDTPGKSNCSGQCAINWPPYIVSDAASLKADSSVKGALATIKRDDGSMQVTYNNIPLYFFAKDMKPGDVLGQNVGGVWFIVNP